MNDIDHGAFGYGVGELFAIVDLLAIDERRHVLPELAFIVQDVAARTLVGGEIGVQDFAKRRAVDIARRTFYVPLNVAGKSD